MFELLKDLNEFLRDRELKDTVKVEWKTHEQQVYEMNRQNDLQFAKAVYRCNTETDPEKKAKIEALMTAGIYDIDNYIDKI